MCAALAETWSPCSRAVSTIRPDCQALIELALATYGRIDVLCNIAARAYFNWLEDVTDEEWDRARWGEVDVVFYLTRAAWPQLKASGGVVVNMGRR